MRASKLVVAVALLLTAGPALWGQVAPADPVVRLTAALKTPARDLKARDAEVADAVARLRTFDHYRRAVLLPDWRDADEGDPCAAFDRRHRGAVLERFTAAVRGVLHGGGLDERLDLLKALTALDGRGPDGEPLGRAFAGDVVALTHAALPALRAAAARALGHLPAEPDVAASALWDLLKDDDPALRAVAAEALGALTAQAGRATTTDERAAAVVTCRAALPAAAAGFGHTNTQVRGRCVEAAGRAATALARFLPSPVVPDDADGLPAFVRQLDEETTALLPLAQALKEQTPAFARAAADVDPRVRLLARQALEDIAEARSRLLRRAAAILAVRDGQASEEARERAATLQRTDLLCRGLVEALPALTLGLDDPDVRARRATVDVLETLGRAALPALPALVKALSDRDRFVRWAAARALGKVRAPDPEQVVPHLARLLSDTDANLRVAAATALRDYGPGARSALPDLLDASRSADNDLRLAVLRAVETIGSEDAAALAVVEAALGDSDVRVRRLADEVASKVGSSGRAAAERLLRDKTTPDGKTVGSAAKKP